CESNLSLASHCGNCSNDCNDAFIGLNVSTPICSSSICTIGECAFNYGDCDGLVKNGCESNLLGDDLNCNGCGLTCWNSQVATAQCIDGECSITCETGFRDCDGNADNGCEVD